MHKLINAGFGNMISMDKIVAVISPNSAPAKRLKDEARDRGLLFDITQGRRTRALIITTPGQIYLSSVQVETLATRFQQESGRPPSLTDMPESVEEPLKERRRKSA